MRSRSALLGLAMAAIVPPTGHAWAADPELSSRVWDLTPLYTSGEAWEADRVFVSERIGTISRLRGTLATSAQTLADGLDAVADLRDRAAKLALYGFLLSDTDDASPEARRYYDVGTLLEFEVESAVAFATEEIRSIGPERLHEWLAAEPRLERHRARIDRVVAETPYSVGTEAQGVLESAARWPRLSSDIFDALHASDLGWPRSETSPGGRTLDRAEYLHLRRSGASATRLTDLHRYLQSLERLQNVFALLYTRRVEADLILARHRHFTSGIDALWFLRDGMPPGSFRTMITTTRAHLDMFHRLSRLRAEASGSDRPSYADLFVSVSGGTDSIPLSRALDITVAASAPLGPDYVARLRESMQQSWMHLPPQPHKSGTYAIWPPVAGIPPYVQMTYDGSYNSARAFTGAVTLMMSYDAWRRANAPDTRDDPAIYSNGIIYVGDMLHDEYTAEHSDSAADRKIAEVHAVDFFRAHFLQWVLAADFDAQVEELVADGRTPDGERLSEIYLGLLREYYGPAVAIDDDFGREWMINAVPFLSYEHQFWPAAVAAACELVEGLRRGDPRSSKAVEQVLGSSGTDRSYGLLQECGVDLSRPDPYLAVFAVMSRWLHGLERDMPEVGTPSRPDR
jgi:oligoendopeptidase F